MKNKNAALFISLLFGMFLFISCDDNSTDPANNGGNGGNGVVPDFIGKWKLEFRFGMEIDAYVDIKMQDSASQMYATTKDTATGGMDTMFIQDGGWTASADSVFFSGDACRAPDSVTGVLVAVPCGQVLAVKRDIRTDSLWYLPADVLSAAVAGGGISIPPGLTLVFKKQR